MNPLQLDKLEYVHVRSNFAETTSVNFHYSNFPFPSANEAEEEKDRKLVRKVDSTSKIFF